MAPRRAVTRQGDLLKLSGDTFTIKEELKRLGARYDGGQKCWFVAQDDSIAKKLEFLGFLAIPNPPEVISTSSNKSPLTTHELNEGSQEGVSERANESVWSVSQFSLFVENIFRQHLSFDFWIVGEISSLKTSSGHVYFDLLETEQERTLHTGRAASVSCCLWAGKIRLLADKLSECPLAEGMKVKLQVHCDFRREGSRLSLIIDDLDPSFTLGDLTIKRQQIVRELKRRGLYDRQRNTHRWSLFPVRIALLTAAGSRAHSDFMDELKKRIQLKIPEQP